MSADPAASGAGAHGTQVLVVGGGPVGMLLAGELRLGGAEVTVLERDAVPGTESRASTLHARTMEHLDARGLLSALGTPPNEPRGHLGGIPLDLTLPSAYPGQWKVPQTRTQELLEDWARSLGADIRRGYELRSLTVREHGVTAEAAGPDGTVGVRADYAVACDGENSTVRRLTGADFPGHDARHVLLRADVAGIDIPARRFERLPDGLAVAARRDDGVTRVMVHERDGEPGPGEPEFVDVVAAWKRVTGEDISGGTPLWVNSFGDACRQLTHYRHGRLYYAGDAAHRQLPAGGQALNLGLQDAANLGWKLAAAVQGRAPSGLLDSYHAERHAVGRRVLANVETQAALLFGGAETEPLRAMLAELIQLEPVRRHQAGLISGLDVRYPVTGAGEPGHPLAGARLPLLRLAGDLDGDVDAASDPDGAPGDRSRGETTSHELLRAGKGLLLGLTGARGLRRLHATAAGWTDRVRVAAGTVLPARAGEVPETTGVSAVLVRPDGYVVWVEVADDSDSSDSSGGLTDALRRWFGEPAGPAQRRTRGAARA